MTPVGCVSGCGRVAVCRGLCKTCLDKARARVAAGETTWAALERQGKALPPRPRVRPPWGTRWG